jgi:amino acid transporter
MSILRDVFAELFSMFVSDAPLTAAILVVVASAAALAGLGAPAWLVGGALLLGCVAVLVESVTREARRRRR